eukprot:m.350444 g.350444  ORF g.350444 m.350444 type:complete len:192 (+) comp20693_c0_seq3:230-805(+)
MTSIVAVYSAIAVSVWTLFSAWRRTFRSWKKVSYDEHGNVTKCLFCDITGRNVPPGETVPFDDAIRDGFELSAFYPTSPAAALHILIVPKIHVRNVTDVSDRRLIEAMLSYGRDVLARKSEHRQDMRRSDTVDASDLAQARFSFHVSPYNSVDHLHLHCQLPPFASTIKDIMYTPDKYPWCMSATRKLASL